MQLGIHVIQPPSTRAPAVLEASAHAAEALGYRTIWVGDRLIEGVDGRIGEGRPLDALATLAFLAASTERIRLGTSVLAGAWYPPALLARSLATVDQLSRGRLTIGLGASPSRVESEAAGIDHGAAEGLVDDLLGAIAACWRPEPVDHRSERIRLGGRAPGPLPVQRPRPPILLTADDEAGLARVGRLGDGWHAGEGEACMLGWAWQEVRRSADAAGRDPDALAFVARVALDDQTSGAAVARRVAALGAVGATEVVLEVGAALGLDAALARYAAVAEAVELQSFG